MFQIWEKFWVKVEDGFIVVWYMWVASSLNVMFRILLQEFFKVSFSGSLVLSSMISMQFSSGDFCQSAFWFSLANSSACFSFL